MKKLAQGALVAAMTMAGTLGSGQAQEKPWPIDEMMGKPEAPITIIEYASLTCPHCAEFEENTLPELKKNWIDTGKAKLVFRDFPTPPVPLAQAAAMVAHCSGDRYFAFIDTFFRTQGEWVRSNNPLDAIKTIAKLGGMGSEQVDKCITDQTLLNQINARTQEASQKLGVDSTPSFIIGGKVYSGYKSYDEMAAILNEQAKK